MLLAQGPYFEYQVYKGERGFKQGRESIPDCGAVLAKVGGGNILVNSETSGVQRSWKPGHRSWSQGTRSAGRGEDALSSSSRRVELKVL